MRDPLYVFGDIILLDGRFSEGRVFTMFLFLRLPTCDSLGDSLGDSGTFQKLDPQSKQAPPFLLESSGATFKSSHVRTLCPGAVAKTFSGAGPTRTPSF